MAKFKKAQLSAIQDAAKAYQDIKGGIQEIRESPAGQVASEVKQSLTPDAPQVSPADWELAMNTLANAFSLMGVNIQSIKNKDGFVDSEKLQLYLGQNAPMMFQTKTQDNIISLANTISEFASVANAFLPSNVGEKFLDWFKKQVARGDDIKNIQNKITNFIDDMSDRSAPKDEYVWAQLTGNYMLASILKVLYSFGKFDKETFNTIKDIQMEALRQLGPQSEGLTQALSILDAKAASNFQKIMASNRRFRFMAPIITREEKAKQLGYQLSRKIMDNDLLQAAMENDTLMNIFSAEKMVRGWFNGVVGK